MAFYPFAFYIYFHFIFLTDTVFYSRYFTITILFIFNFFKNPLLFFIIIEFSFIDRIHSNAKLICNYISWIVNIQLKITYKNGWISKITKWMFLWKIFFLFVFSFWFSFKNISIELSIVKIWKIISFCLDTFHQFNVVNKYNNVENRKRTRDKHTSTDMKECNQHWKKTELMHQNCVFFEYRSTNWFQNCTCNE